jgi:hypothetical protein
MPNRTLQRRQVAYSLAELLVSMVSSTILVGGLAGTLYIASTAINTDDNGNRHGRIAGEILGDLIADLRHAKMFTERTATAVAFTVPDRNGDSSDEIVRYAWAGTAGDPLTYQINGGTVTTLAANVQHFNLTALERLMLGVSLEETPAPSGGVEYHNFSEALSTSGTTLSIAAPTDVVEGDLLIAVVVRDFGGADLSASWDQIVVADGDSTGSLSVCVGVWWKIAGSSEPPSYSFNLAQSQDAYGWIMRFSGHDPTSPIHAVASAPGTGSAPTAPAVATTVDNTMILRIGGFDDDDITVDNPGVAGHTAITMDKSAASSSSSSGGAAYVTQATAGDSGTATFALTASEQYRTVTIAIAPDQP